MGGASSGMPAGRMAGEAPMASMRRARTRATARNAKGSLGRMSRAGASIHMVSMQRRRGR